MTDPTPTPPWVAPFYARQAAWSGGYTRPVEPADHERVDQLLRLAGTRSDLATAAQESLRVLELGAGGGQAAAAAAARRLRVTAVELVPELAAHARALAAAIAAGPSATAEPYAAVALGIDPGPAADSRTDGRPGRLTVLEGDFYTLDPDGPFDVVCYWDGFGIGSDDDQRLLLRRIHGWLAPGGCALIEVYTPWYWAAVAGREQHFGDGSARRYGFDADGCRMLDRWWPEGREEESVTQSLRAYSPADLRLLLEGTGLVLDGIEAGGAWDEVARVWREQVPLDAAMGYVARLVAAGTRT
ncbi:MAG: class I SAM-dependent methyltransferase [Ardenticatenia bacterium]|nr:class I SAM-dependent methyltransferase [Ardenticatenia bacterium]